MLHLFSKEEAEFRELKFSLVAVSTSVRSVWYIALCRPCASSR